MEVPVYPILFARFYQRLVINGQKRTFLWQTDCLVGQFSSCRDACKLLAQMSR